MAEELGGRGAEVVAGYEGDVVAVGRAGAARGDLDFEDEMAVNDIFNIA